MRDLFHFLYRARNTLLFLGLMMASLMLLTSGNAHHRASALTSSNAVVGRIYTWRSDITTYASLRDVNLALARENAHLRSMSLERNAPDTFPHPVDSARAQPFQFIPAQVINSTVLKQKNYLTLDKGAADGILPGMGVIGAEGILGVTWNTSARFATVISVLNTDLSSSVMLARTQHFGLLVWDTGDPQRAHVSDIATHVQVQPGDTVVTRGGDGVFPAGITVGVVEHVDVEPGSNYHAILILLSEDMSRSGAAYVVVDHGRAERDSLTQRDPEP